MTSDWADTGFGRVMKELLPRLAKTGLFDITMLGWVYEGDTFEYDRAKELGIRLEATKYWNPRDRYGEISSHILYEKIKPHIIFTLGDIWMTQWVMKAKFRPKVRWVMYVPIDHDNVSQYFVPALKDADTLVLYTHFAAKTVNQVLPQLMPEVIYHGVDCKSFMPLDRDRVKLHTFKLTKDHFVIGQCCRNQSRKLVARTFKVFKTFNCKTFFENREVCHKQIFRCDKCSSFCQDEGKAQTILYLHMTDGSGRDVDDGPGISWNINELTYRFKLEGKISVTKGITVRKGLPDEGLNLVYNLFDVHVLTTKREGFGLPILECMAAGTPNIVPDYSSSAELVENGGGMLARVQTFLNETDGECESAIVDIEDMVLQLEDLYRNPQLRETISKQGRIYAENLAWDNLTDQWVNVFKATA